MPKKHKSRFIYLRKSDPSNMYADSAEDILLKVYANDNPRNEILHLLNSKPDWPIYYHLSPARGNIVSWYHFKNGARVLEVGAGCGAITEALAEKSITVDALELSEKRSKINALRNKSHNITFIVGNLQSFNPSNLYDYIVCIGVLEYAGSFIDDAKPYDGFLQRLKSFLNPQGKLILAIENRLGLKYWAGAREDHTGQFFDSLNQYPSAKKVQTFGKQELSELLSNNGFAKQSFYYPFPDYKLPTAIYSDEYYPGNGCTMPLSSLPSQSLDQTRVHLYSESLAMMGIEKNGLFTQFSNSFLVVANE